jgi:hypothetical protein
VAVPFVISQRIPRALAAFGTALVCSLAFFLAFGLLFPRLLCTALFGPDVTDWGPGDGAGILNMSLFLAGGISFFGLPILAICLYEWWGGALSGAGANVRVRSNNRWRGP